MKEKTIKFEENAFDILRILAALQVMFGHMVEHYGLLESSHSKLFGGLLTFFQYIPGRGVIIFFVISGFLVIPSIEKSTTLQYFVKKVSRIFPGLWFALFLNTGIIFFLHGLSESLLDNIIYFITQLTAFQFYTGSWLRDYGVGTPNGALWTITVLIQFYIVAVIFYKYMKSKGVKSWVCLIVFFQGVSLVIGNLSNVIPSILFKLLSVSLIPYFYIFIIGMFVYQYRSVLLSYLKKNAWIVGGIYIIARIIVIILDIPLSMGVNYDIISATLLSFAVIGIAYRVGKIKLKYDLSYGIFIYHMIFVNVFVHLISNNVIVVTSRIEFTLLIVTLLITLLMSYISTKYIELPCKKWCINLYENKILKNK